MDDIVERLSSHTEGNDVTTSEIINEAAAEIKRLRAMLDAVDDLHEPTSVEDPRCSSCGDWPCPTHLIVCDECKEARRG